MGRPCHTHQNKNTAKKHGGNVIPSPEPLWSMWLKRTSSSKLSTDFHTSSGKVRKAWPLSRHSPTCKGHAVTAKPPKIPLLLQGMTEEQERWISPNPPQARDCVSGLFFHGLLAPQRQRRPSHRFLTLSQTLPLERETRHPQLCPKPWCPRLGVTHPELPKRWVPRAGEPAAGSRSSASPRERPLAIRAFLLKRSKE